MVFADFDPELGYFELRPFKFFLLLTDFFNLFIFGRKLFVQNINPSLELLKLILSQVRLGLLLNFLSDSDPFLINLFELVLKLLPFLIG